MTSTITDRNNGTTSGQAQKVPCVTISTANISLSGLQTISGVTVTSSDRVLVSGQTDQSANGIYSADTGSWTRTADFDGAFDVVSGTLVTITSGTYADTFWKVATSNPITIGSSNITFSLLDLDSDEVVATVQTYEIDVGGLRPRTSNGCSAVTTVAGSSNQPDYDYRAFDGDANEYGQYFVIMPNSYDGDPFDMTLAWQRASGTGAANVVWAARAIPPRCKEGSR